METSVSDRKERRRHHVAAGTAWIIVALSSLLLSFYVDGPLQAGLVIGFSSLSVALALRHLYRPGGRVVLVYHSISEDQSWLPWSDQIAVTPDSFDRQLAMLRNRGFRFVSTRDLLRQTSKGDPGAENTLAIHIDDGYLDNWVAAAPILRRHSAPATMFVSLDFVAAGGTCRPTIERMRKEQDGQTAALDWRGYMNWPEIASLDSSDLIDIQPHGVDHARVPVSDRIVAEVAPDNWRGFAWIQWRNMRGNKSEWWRAESPSARPYGTPIPESAPALSTPAWLGDRWETSEEYTTRVRSDLLRCQQVFRERLGKQPELFCWPENGTSESARSIAAGLGYVGTTAGVGENRPGEPASVISRLHVGDAVLGFHCLPADLLYLYASVRCFQGYYYWYFVMLPMQTVRRIASIVKGARTRSPSLGAVGEPEPSRSGARRQFKDHVHEEPAR